MNHKHCRRGHELTPENTSIRIDGNRTRIRCTVCEQITREQREKHTGYMRLYRQNNLQQVTINNRKARLKQNGWTPELYAEAMSAQGGRCAICGKTAEESRNKRLYADHKHIHPPLPRGLLCSQCNRALGMFMDSASLLEKAMHYIQRFDG
jgi:hypothetical protein